MRQNYFVKLVRYMKNVYHIERGLNKCESACPQHLKITELLKDVSATFDVTPAFPTKK